MVIDDTLLDDTRRREPWFDLHHVLAVSVAVVLFIAILVLSLTIDRTADPLSVLYVLPVSLVAFAFGVRGGLAAGAVAVGFLLIWATSADHALGVLGWVSRVGSLLLLGLLVGATSDRIREARRAERYALAVALVQRDAAEINDSVVQGLAAAKWLLESGQVDRAMGVIDETAEQAQSLVSRVLGAGGVLGDDVRNPMLVMRSSGRRPGGAAAG